MLPHPFDSLSQTEVIFGAGSLSKLGDSAKEHGYKSALLVTDSGIVAAGHADKAKDILEASGVKVAIFDRVEQNPTTLQVSECVERAKEADIDVLIGIGGGSSLDTAKGCNFILTNGGEMADYWGKNKATKPMLPLIAIPTTSGTGSECQTYALIADEKTHRKMACGDDKAAAKIAILDPELTLSLPRQVTVCTGLDALVHAIECAVTKSRNSISLAYAQHAFRLISRGFPKVLENASDIEARGDMLLGAAYAGSAIHHSMLGAAHACANPLTARHDLIHGKAVSIMIPHVMKHNAKDQDTRRLYDEFAGKAGCPDASFESLHEKVLELYRMSELPDKLEDHGIDATKISQLSEDATKEWTGTFNPVELQQSDFLNLYENALNGHA